MTTSQSTTRNASGSAVAGPAPHEVRRPLEVTIQRRPNPASSELSKSDALWPGRLRQAIRARLELWGCSDLADTAELIGTELLTNALRHASSLDVTVRVYTRGNLCLISVSDGSSSRPELRHADLDDESGRGLLLVDALASSWGTSPDGTTTWCTLPLPEGTTDMPPAVPAPPVLHETALPLPPDASAVRIAQIKARTLLLVMAWPGPHDVAVNVLYILVRNAVEHGLTEESSGRRLEVWLRVNHRLELLIDVQDHRPDFPAFEQAAQGRLGRGLMGAQVLGASLSWFPEGQGKIVRATMQPGPVGR
ncbi:ATP-binding protein [Streptomyces sp. NPDC056362]|uniref:ATP-binding protein n=1 Tax=unclassified Streptomyces TaxID=2593676 RepID=UPI0035E100C0